MFNGNYYTDYTSAIARQNNLNNHYYSRSNRINRITSLRKISSNDNNIKETRHDRRHIYSENLKKYQEYKTKSQKFYSEFNDKFTELKNSAKKLEEYSDTSVFTKNNVNSESKEDESKIVNAVKDFAEDYNNAVNFLDANNSVSEEVKSLSNSYKSIKYNSDELDDIGINVNYKTGLLSVNEEKLTAAVRSNGNKVRNVLGNLSNGIASRIYNKTSFAINNAKELYPAAQLETNHINNTYFYNPNNSSILQSNVAYSTGLLLNYLV